MFQRKLINKLLVWKDNKDRKPLILRGARQVGKTTLVELFSTKFDFFINLNLDIKKDREIFENNDDVQKIIQIIFLEHNIPVTTNKTVLLFIDEIQNSSNAIKLLRYFYENINKIHVIAAGSLFENLLNKNISYPVGRVEYLVLRPFSFEEFLMASNEEMLIKICNEIPFPNYGHSKILKIFNDYCLIGGMPEIVKNYLENKDLVLIKSIFNNLITTYLDDVEKYANKNNDIHIIRHVIQNSLRLAGDRIKFEGFGESNYKSKDIGEAFKTLEKTFLLQLNYPTTNVKVPLIENKRKSPKLQLLDTGILNYFAGIQNQILTSNNIDNVFEGKIAEHIVGQEIMSANTSPLSKNTFWIKEKKQSNAEVDYIFQYKDLLIPIEVKLGKTGRLRSLMEFIDLCPHNFAIRVYSGELRIDKVKTIKGKDFFLMNLPFYLISKIEDYLEWLISSY
ncbi:MAG: AAA family ATPase [Bacteroidales bacterium]|nr:AAA family ATPase [Bacteroidales bacterium]